MTAAADSTALKVSPAEREADGEGSGATGHLPVFAAFDELGLTGRDVAELTNVTPPTVSKWRSAKVRIPGDKLQFLTLVLAHILDEAGDTVVGHTHETNGGLEANASLVHKDGPQAGVFESARAQLAYQEVLNRELPASEVREGAQKFRTWWASGEAQKLQDKHFTPQTSAAVLEALKKMRTMS